jgi:NadR type nicotinamide-nucleotide adenylyltransferase
MFDKTIKIVITGAESTGKSILSEALAKHYSALWIPELARNYVETLGRHYTYRDIELIARMQIEEEKKISDNQNLVFFDTWLIITKVWFEFVYGKSPEWLHKYISESSIDLFLLCDTDIPWESDPVRENGGESRIRLQELYIEQLENYGFNYHLISGLGDSRLKMAIGIIDDFLKNDRCNMNILL